MFDEKCACCGQTKPKAPNPRPDIETAVAPSPPINFNAIYDGIKARRRTVREGAPV